MEIAKLIVEYLKVLMWPLVTLFLVLRFRVSIFRILNALGDRLVSAESVKVGLLGQEVEISGTAIELKAERQELLASSSADPRAREKAGRLHRAIPQLNNPMADVVGLALMNAPRQGLSIDELIEAVSDAIGRPIDFKAMGAQAKVLLLGISREVERVLAELTALGFTTTKDDRYSLSPSGRDFFKRVIARQEHLLRRFMARPTEP